MTKTFILDTNVLLHDPDSLFAFGDNRIVICLPVIKELDRKKGEQGLIGKHSRQVARAILSLCVNRGRVESGGYEGGVLAIPLNEYGGEMVIVNEEIGAESVDDHLLKLAQEYRGVLVSKDNYLRIKAEWFGISNATYEHDLVKEEYTGHVERLAPADLIDDIYEGSKSNNDRRYSLLEIFDRVDEVYPNQCLTLTADTDPKHSALCIVSGDGRHFSLINSFKGARVCGVKPLNSEQRYAMHLLQDPNIKLVTINGSTGSGKTMMSLAAGIQQTVSGGYESVIVTRQEVAVGGEKQPWLPGPLQEKQDPWLKGIYHCLNKIAKTHQPNLDGSFNKPYEYYLSTGIVVPETLAYVRGTTYDSYIVMTEAQNCHPSIIKTLVTRAGNQAKVVLEGDVKQIDCVSPRFLDEYSNGLSVTIDRWKGSEVYGHISLRKNVRSALSMEAESRFSF